MEKIPEKKRSEGIIAENFILLLITMILLLNP